MSVIFLSPNNQVLIIFTYMTGLPRLLKSSQISSNLKFLLKSPQKVEIFKKTSSNLLKFYFAKRAATEKQSLLIQKKDEL